ncbi:MAG: carboxypeptidase-like regulatory domain-containing protein [Bacteroidaceae bacterium]|nr:carboxypeptidase-like regulatory domain-containing protein [Bacteroidaceae bacterium]MBQ9293423.1 carboxypeptidase-like regulatory domain-containing protein [Bacteroidaceae bacterium]
MRSVVTLLLTMFFVLSWAQERVLQGHVVDAATGEPLPYAAVYKESGSGVMTNVEGEYRLSATEQDVLTFSFVGYEKLRLRASELPQTVRLTPFEQVLREVVVMPMDEWSIVSQVISNLKSDFSKHKNKKQPYFMRALLKNKEDSYLIESILSAKSAVNLREEEMLSGRTGLNMDGSISRINLRLSNIQRMTEVGPSAFKSRYWEQSVKPLYSLRMAKDYYDIEVGTLLGSDGERLYRIEFRMKKEQRQRWKRESLADRRHIIGTAYINAKTLRLLRFDGKVDNAYQSVNFQRTPTDINFCMNYDYSNGYAVVNYLSFKGGNEGMRYQGILYGIRDDSLLVSLSVFEGDNIINTLGNAGFDEALWERLNIVKRTAEEEKKAHSQSLP